ncbi:cyclic nucleotide-binding domain protein (macronuclear) [Tetrahymena thermophila SB210]|uniref:Cyclic nucleotide-binding domain protein n=1 Tax=Tetrahymena thermophila (strain SB210) TaxID=312017 RepID=I7MIY0_TETTS|nr:cyclic nucleotide-binding domain protein [Tetrahymena thermophila SB210]EAR95653.2 cyclic nucleotide-binding domain protein [Tetrahymena thermophila SB210]|eukprot:XP_001015898.2 cyclic nucleotide-binding domain protein [Tetrahymena thermophila SB210]
MSDSGEQKNIQQEQLKSNEQNKTPKQLVLQNDLNHQTQIKQQNTHLSYYIYNNPQKEAQQNGNIYNNPQKESQQNGNIQNESLKDSASFESSDIKNSDLMESSLNSKSFQKFKKFHEKKLNDKVHQLLEQEKKSDKRKSEFLLNILDQQQFKFIKSKSNSLERRESTTTNEEAFQTQTKEQNLNSTQKMNKKQSIFFNNTMSISQFNSSFESNNNNNNNKLEMIIENKDFAKDKSQQLLSSLPVTPIAQNRQQQDEIYEKQAFPQIRNQKEKLEFKQQLDSNQMLNIKNRNSFKSFQSGNQNEKYSSGNKIQNYQGTDLTPNNLNEIQRVKENQGANHQKLKNILDISKMQRPQTQAMLLGQNDSQFFSNNRYRQLNQLDLSEKNISLDSSQINKNINPNSQNKNQSSINQFKGIQNQSYNQISPKANFEQSQTAFHQQDKFSEKKNLGKESNSQRHDMCKISFQGYVGDLKSQQIEQKEQNKIKKQQFLEKINNRVCYSKANQQSINSENQKFDQLDYQAEQLKELIDSSPAKICSNINNILSFKKKFLKILKSQPDILQKKLFDFKLEKDKYIYQKQNQNNSKIVNKNLNQNSLNLTINKDLKQIQPNQSHQTSQDQNQTEDNKLNFSTMQDSIKENNSIFEENSSFQQTKNKKSHKIQSPIDSILLFIKQQKSQQKQIIHTEQQSFERYRQDSIFSNFNQTSSELKNSFFQSPKINFSDQCSSKQDKSNITTKIVDIIDKSTISNVELFQDLSIKPEAGFVKKLSISSQKQPPNNNKLLQKTFQNQISDSKHKYNQFKSQQFITPNNKTQSSKVYQNFDFKTFQTERLSQKTQEKQSQVNLKIQSSQEKNIHQLTNINFSVNQQTGKADDSNYVISSTLTLRKPISQRIKEKQIKQKGNSLAIQTNYNPSKTFTKSKDSSNFQEDISFKQQTTKSSQNFFSIQNFYSNNSPKIQDSVYHFQKIAPSKKVKKNFFLNS